MRLLAQAIALMMLASCASNSTTTNSPIVDKTMKEISFACENASFMNPMFRVQEIAEPEVALSCPLSDTTSLAVTLLGFTAEDYSRNPTVMVEGMYVIFQNRIYAYNGTAQSINPGLKSDKIPVRFDKAEFRDWLYYKADAPDVEISGCMD